MNDNEATSLVVAAQVAMKKGELSEAVTLSLGPLREREGMQGNVSVAFFDQTGATALTAEGTELSIDVTAYPAFQDPEDRDAIDICALPGSLDSYCEVHHTCFKGLFCKKGTCRPCQECRYQGDSTGPEPTNTLTDPPGFTCPHTNCPLSPVCPNRLQSDGVMSEGCPTGCPTRYDPIWMPPQCTNMIPDTEVNQELIAMEIQDYCGSIADVGGVIWITVILAIGVMCGCGLVKMVFDGLEADVIDDKACMRDGLYRGRE